MQGALLLVRAWVSSVSPPHCDDVVSAPRPMGSCSLWATVAEAKPVRKTGESVGVGETEPRLHGFFAFSKCY